MAFRVSRRAKYVVVLAFISLCLYGSLGTDKLSAITPSAYPIHLPPLDQFSPSSFFDSADDSEQDKFSDTDDPLIDETVVTLPLKSSVDHSSIDRNQASTESVTIPDQDFLTGDSLASTDDISSDSAKADSGSASPLKEPLPISTPMPLSEDDKFSIGRIEKYPVAPETLIKLPSQSGSSTIPKIQTTDPSLDESSSEKAVRLQRRDEIRDVFRRDWEAYRKYAWMHDELRPVTNVSKDPFGGWGATLVDALDTLLIMELDEEYKEASDAVAKIDFTYTQSRAIPLFETVIRYLGGLLAAYDLGVASGRKDPVMLSQAKKLGHVLYGAFDTPNRMPLLHYDYRKQARSQETQRASQDSVMSEAGSLSVEFTRLAQLSGGQDGDRIFDAIQRVTNALEESMDSMLLKGLWPLRLDLSGCEPKKTTKSTLSVKPGTTVVPKPGAPTFLKEAIDLSTGKTRDDSLARAHQATESLIDVLHDQKASTKFTNTKKRQISQEFGVDQESTSHSEEQCRKQGIRPFANSYTQIYSQGGLADSTYEYFTKEYLLLGGGTEAQQYKRLYEQSIEATIKWLLFKPLVPGNLGNHDILMSGDVSASANKTPVFQAKMQHLTCFIGGMFAMGSKVFERPEDLKLAARLTDGCVWAYNYTATGVSPEVFHLRECKKEECKWQDYLDEIDAENRSREAIIELQKPKQESNAPDWAEDEDIDRTPTVSQKRSASNSEMSSDAASFAQQNFEQSQRLKAGSQAPTFVKTEASAMFMVDDRYILRPEAIESVWYMYRITGDKQWQEKGWKMWKATEELTRTNIAHSAVSNLMDADHPLLLDSLESFWFAETLKYYYLLFSDFQTVSLDEYVLNTEAHPFRRPDFASRV